ncbi:hypothetical protein FSP39_017934 [Pinctada imbricata]|uniref:DUF6589 domain-containing protein n=1 Tax=Pinctada imbricata TaxID=66713 RepID=A0AA89C3X5_PINIB|nr:hypothetical protein FSP39_017934 [Pinctada imbricata]
MKELKREISYLTSTTNLSLLRRSESRCLATFSFDKVNEEVKLFAPLFHKMVSTITKESCIGTAVTSFIALKSANICTHMSAFQHVIGQVLDHGGATDETIDTLAKMSISVSATRKGQQNLLERQKKHISNLLENELSTQNTYEETQAHLKMRVFGGDVLTNERAYSAQLALHNGTSELDRLQCVIHRPEGLHRIMNHLLFIYQQFYKVTSAGEPGTLSHLRNTVGRVDVHGPDEVIQKYRSHYAFVEDCLDAFIVGAYMHLSGTQNLQTESPLQQTMFNFLSDEQKYTFIHKLAKDILDKYVKTGIHVYSLQKFLHRISV